ncbi:hypothetical protein ILUMI_08401 [Ignelater luminosus]|uniref:Uncharacterized protein n=1 Tax=Ignelater luminosus TaxID=2038154 RepID=A0A8K0D1P9_IGNLU|nr:hypothetical protein ILUMI_08401 [Ignelater luminosus]
MIDATLEPIKSFLSKGILIIQTDRPDPDITDDWKLYAVERIFCDTDDYENAKNKLKRAEVTSDIQTDEKSSYHRKRKKVRRFSCDEIGLNKSDSETEEESQSLLRLRPPQPKKVLPSVSYNIESVAANSAISTETPLPATQTSTTSFSDHADIENKNTFGILLTEILKLKEQNKQILNLLQKSVTINENNLSVPENLPIALSVQTLEDLEKLEAYLNEKSQNAQFKKMLKYYKEAVGERQVRDSIELLNIDDTRLESVPETESSLYHNNVTLDGSTELISYNSNTDSELAFTDDSLSSEEITDNTAAYNLEDELRQWALQNKVSHVAFTDLFHVLSPLHLNLPLCSKTLLHTPRNVINRKQLHCGEYIHFGLENCLRFLLSKNPVFLNSSNVINISFNIDGLSLFSSSSIQFWPILGLIVNSSEVKLKPFAIGVFCGNCKPSPLSSFLEDFVSEMSPVVFKDNMPKAVYEHYLLLHFGSSILLCKRHLENIGISIAQDLLNIFVSHCEVLYGLQYLIYNVHVLSRLSEEAAIYGPLDNISAFSFENYLGTIKKLIRSPNKPLKQLFHRLSEANHALTNFENITLKYYFQQYKKLFNKNMLYTTNTYSNENSYCLTVDRSVVQIHNILVDPKQIFLIGKKICIL